MEEFDVLAGLPQWAVLVLTLGALLLAVMTGWLLYDWARREEPSRKEPSGRGQTLVSQSEVPRWHGDDAAAWWWAGSRLPYWLSSIHGLLVGSTGSGKSTLMNILMAFVLRFVGAGYGRRALVWDAKGDVLPLLKGMKLSAPIVVMHPFDCRGVFWDMASDFCSFSEVESLCAIVASVDEAATQKFFDRAAAITLMAVVTNWLRVGRRRGTALGPIRWRLRDIVCAMTSLENLKLCLHQSAEGRDLYQLLYSNEETAHNILATIITRIAPYSLVAAAWHGCEKSMCLTDWVEGESILVLSNSFTAAPSVSTLNVLLLTRLFQILLQKPSHPNPNRDLGGTWCFFDEFQELPPLGGDVLRKVFLMGRSKLIRIIAGIQEVESIRATYGRERANAMLGQLRSKVVLQLDDPESRVWASSLAGQWEGPETSRSRSYNAEGGESFSINVGTKLRDSILPSEFATLGLASRETGLSFFSFLPGVGVYRKSLDGKWVFDEALPKPDPHEPAHLERSPDCQILLPWTPEDRERLCLQDPPPFPPASPAPSRTARQPLPAEGPPTPSDHQLKLAALEVLKQRLRHAFELEGR